MFCRPVVNAITELLFDLFKNELQGNHVNPHSNHHMNHHMNQQANHGDQTGQFAGERSNSDRLSDPLVSEMRPSTFKRELSMATENRHYLVIDQAHVQVAEFCVHSLRAITGTLFHFWVMKVI